MSKMTSPLVWTGIVAVAALAVMITIAEGTRRDVQRSIDRCRRPSARGAPAPPLRPARHPRPTPEQVAKPGDESG